jgi:hypothetical protein
LERCTVLWHIVQFASSCCEEDKTSGVHIKSNRVCCGDPRDQLEPSPELVCILGSCREDDQLLIVYMHNDNLWKRLFSKSRATQLISKMRYDILAGC